MGNCLSVFLCIEAQDPVRILASVPYPEGTGPVGYDFTLIHMYTENVNGHVPGEISIPEVVRKDQAGIWFYADSLSPVAVGWNAALSGEATVPQTGDSTPIALLCLLTALSGVAILLMVRRRRHG